MLPFQLEIHWNGLMLVVRDRNWRNAEIPMATTPSYKRDCFIPKIGRNDPCLCGSGGKYKKCCGGAAVN